MRRTALVVTLVLFVLPAAVRAQASEGASIDREPLVFGVFIAGIEEGGRIFTPVRLLPFEHPDAMNHEFPNALVNFTGEVDALVQLGEATGLLLRTTLMRYPRVPVDEWPYSDFAEPPLECLRQAELHRSGRPAAIPGLRALFVRDGVPLTFIVDTRRLTLREREMHRPTSMGLDVTREQFLQGLTASVPGGATEGCHIVTYPIR